MNHEAISLNYLEDAIRSFRSYKRLAERALEQVNDDEFFIQIDEESIRFIDREAYCRQSAVALA